MPNDAQVQPHFTGVCLLRVPKEGVIVSRCNSNKKDESCWKLGRKSNAGEHPACVRHTELRQHAPSKHRAVDAEHRMYGAEKRQN